MRSVGNGIPVGASANPRRRARYILHGAMDRRSAIVSQHIRQDEQVSNHRDVFHDPGGFLRAKPGRRTTCDDAGQKRTIRRIIRASRRADSLPVVREILRRAVRRMRPDSRRRGKGEGFPARGYVAGAKKKILELWSKQKKSQK